MDDLQIIELYFARDESAIRETDQKYGRLCYRVAGNLLNNDQDTEECVNDTYLSVWNAIPPARPTHFMAYLCKVARNLALKKLESRTAIKRISGVMIPLHELEELLPDDSIAAHIENEAISKAITAFLRSEKADARHVFIRRYLYMDSIEQIASRYGFGKSKVKNLLYHSRIRLKEYLKKEGIEV